MFKQFRFVFAALISGAIIVFTTAVASAFSQQIVTPNDNYNFNYGPLDDKTKLNESPDKSKLNNRLLPHRGFDVHASNRITQAPAKSTTT